MKIKADVVDHILALLIVVFLFFFVMAIKDATANLDPVHKHHCGVIVCHGN